MNKMHLLFVSPQTSGRITAMTAAGGITYIAHGSTVSGYKRGKPVSVSIYNEDNSILNGSCSL